MYTAYLNAGGVLNTKGSKCNKKAEVCTSYGACVN